MKIRFDVFIDTDFMEANRVEFSKKFIKNFTGLEKADLLLDIIYLLKKDKDKSFKKYIKEVKAGKYTENKTQTTI